MKLFSIYITDSGAQGRELPRLVARNIESFRRVHPDMAHELHTDASIRDFIRDCYDRSVLDAYIRLRPYAYKADLARYCLLHQHGGVYADITYRFRRPWYPDERRISVFRDLLNAGPPWSVANGVIASPPRHAALAKAIGMVCQNVRDRRYGSSPLSISGPELFGRALALSCEAADVIAGEAQLVGPFGRHCLVHDYVVAVKTKRGGTDVGRIGIVGGNNYNPMWTRREVYGEAADDGPEPGLNGTPSS
jgi:hypothetical protein